MTSNIGSHIIQEQYERLDGKNDENIIDDTTMLVFEELKKHVRPEFLNRIDDVIMFTPLDKENIKEIVNLNLKTVAKRLKKSDIEFEWTDSALNHIADAGFDPQFGARPIKRVIQKEILNKLSKDILANNVSADAKIILDFENDDIIFINEFEPETESVELEESNQ